MFFWILWHNMHFNLIIFQMLVFYEFFFLIGKQRKRNKWAPKKGPHPMYTKSIHKTNKEKRQEPAKTTEKPQLPTTKTI